MRIRFGTMPPSYNPSVSVVASKDCVENEISVTLLAKRWRRHSTTYFDAPRSDLRDINRLSPRTRIARLQLNRYLSKKSKVSSKRSVNWPRISKKSRKVQENPGEPLEIVCKDIGLYSHKNHGNQLICLLAFHLPQRPQLKAQQPVSTAQYKSLQILTTISFGSLYFSHRHANTLWSLTFPQSNLGIVSSGAQHCAGDIPFDADTVDTSSSSTLGFLKLGVHVGTPFVSNPCTAVWSSCSLVFQTGRVQLPYTSATVS